MPISDCSPIVFSSIFIHIHSTDCSTNPHTQIFKSKMCTYARAPQSTQHSRKFADQCGWRAVTDWLVNWFIRGAGGLSSQLPNAARFRVRLPILCGTHHTPATHPSAAIVRRFLGPDPWRLATGGWGSWTPGRSTRDDVVADLMKIYISIIHTLYYVWIRVGEFRFWKYI